MATPVEHSSLGPSQWDRWVRCPGSVRQSSGVRDQGRYEAAEGTVFHELVSDCLIHGFEPEDCMPGRLVVDGHDIAFDDEMAASARDGLAFVREMAAQPGWRLYVETQVDISPWTQPGQFGTADVVLVNIADRWIIVFDWKYGKEPVYPEENYQLSGYALGAWQTIVGPLFDHDPAGVKATLIIEQPRVPGAGGAWETTMTRLLEFGQHVRRQAMLTQAEHPPIVPGPKQCRWCLARDKCGPQAEWLLENAGLNFEALDVLIEADAAPVLPEEVTPERRSYLLSLRPLFTQWFDALHKSAYHDANVGRPTPGLKMVLGRHPARKIAANAAHKYERALVRLLGERAYSDPVLLSPAQAETLVGRKTYETELARFVDVGHPQPVLVPESDRRPPVTSAVDLFDVL